MQKRQNNKGMTLLELIISMTIAVIVVFMIITFLSGASRAFRRTNDEVNLQLEAQTAVNRLANLIMEAEAVTDVITVRPDIEYRYGIDSLNLAGYSDYVIIFRKDLKKLFLVDIPPSETPETVDIDEESLNKDYLLAEYMINFDIASEAVTDDSVCIKNISMKLGIGDESHETYEIEKKVKLRNYKK